MVKVVDHVMVRKCIGVVHHVIVLVQAAYRLRDTLSRNRHTGA